jgi:hypothetical protein
MLAKQCLPLTRHPDNGSFKTIRQSGFFGRTADGKLTLFFATQTRFQMVARNHLAMVIAGHDGLRRR